VAEDGLLQLLQSRARLQAELIYERAPSLPVDRERLGLPARAVERAHERGGESLAQRMLVDERLELADELGVTAEREVGVEPPLQRVQAELLEAEGL
jgi:hypothetical protein